MAASDLEEIRKKMHDAQARRLVPRYIQEFFSSALPRVGGRMVKRKYDRFEITSIPMDLIHAYRGSAIAPSVQPRYERITFDVEKVDASELAPPAGDGPLQLGYIDAFHQQPLRLTLKDWASADAVLVGQPEPYRRLDTAILEALVLKGPVGLTEDDISHLRGLSYSRTDAEALELVRSGRYDAAFFLRPTPVTQVQEIAAAGVNMPPKSTFFYPKVPTGLLFNPLA